MKTVKRSVKGAPPRPSGSVGNHSHSLVHHLKAVADLGSSEGLGNLQDLADRLDPVLGPVLDAGACTGTTTTEQNRVKALEREAKELRRSTRS